jgi:hypothetical protein
MRVTDTPHVCGCVCVFATQLPRHVLHAAAKAVTAWGPYPPPPGIVAYQRGSAQAVSMPPEPRSWLGV